MDDKVYLKNEVLEFVCQAFPYQQQYNLVIEFLEEELVSFLNVDKELDLPILYLEQEGLAEVNRLFLIVFFTSKE